MSSTAERPENSDLGTRPEKVRATFHISADLLNEVRNAVVALSGPPHRLTLAQFAEEALRDKLVQLKGDQSGRMRGRDFPQRESELRGGRPIG
jgi:hypothetical protein